MSGPVDTPDYQRGVVSAQTLLATVPHGQPSIDVGVPFNAETIVILCPTGSTVSNVVARGHDSGFQYPAVVGAPNPTGNVFYVDISAAVDRSANIELQGPDTTGIGEWFIYADSGVHVVVSGTSAADSLGSQYVVPVAPSTLADDHPPVEVLVQDAGFTATGPLLPAPGTVFRYRLFYVTISPLVAGSTGALFDAVPNKPLFTGAVSGAASMSYGPSGYAMAEDSALTAALVAGTEFAACVTYTVEAV